MIQRKFQRRFTYLHRTEQKRQHRATCNNSGQREMEEGEAAEMKCRVIAARRPMHTAGAALLLLLLLFLFISRNVWPISRLDAPQGTEARQREKQRDWEGERRGVATRVWNHVNFGRDLRARWNCNSLDCLHRKRKLTEGGKEWSGSGSGDRAWQVYLTLCVSLSKRKLFAFLFAGRPKVARDSFLLVFSRFLLLSSSTAAYSWQVSFQFLFSCVYFVIRYYCVFFFSPSFAFIIHNAQQFRQLLR